MAPFPAGRILAPACSLLVLPMCYRKGVEAAQYLQSLNIHPQSVSDSGVKVLRIVSLKGGCFLPHCGFHQLPTLDLPDCSTKRDLSLSDSVTALFLGDRPTRQPIVVVQDDQEGVVEGTVGVLLDPLRLPPGVNPAEEKYRADARVRVRRLLDRGPGDGTFLFAEVELIEDAPALIYSHAATARALRSFWALLRRLGDAQERAGEQPRFSEQLLQIEQMRGTVLSARDVWLPLYLLQELHVQQGLVALERLEKAGGAVDGSTSPLELARIRRALNGFPELLEMDVGVGLLDAATSLVLEELGRVEHLLGVMRL